MHRRHKLELMEYCLTVHNVEANASRLAYNLVVILSHNLVVILSLLSRVKSRSE